jgi:hypothetical protein
LRIRHDEAVSDARNCLDPETAVPDVSFELAQRADDTVETVVTNVDIPPTAIEERFARNDLACALGKCCEHLHHPRLQMRRTAGPLDEKPRRTDRRLTELKVRNAREITARKRPRDLLRERIHALPHPLIGK